MKKVLIGFGVLILLLVVAVLVAPYVIPTDTYKREIADRIGAATGRELTINGEVSFRLFPTISLNAEDVTLANAPQGQAEHMVTLERLEVRVALWPLLSGNLKIDRLVLVRPEIELEVDGGGNPNWVFTPRRSGGEGAEGGAQEAANAPGGVPAGLTLGDVRIEDGRIRYRDRAGGEAYTLEDVTLSLSLPDAESAFTVDGDLVFNGQHVDLDLRLETLASLAGEDGAGLRVGLESDLVTLSFSGRARMAQAFSVNGPIELNVPSLRALAAWLNGPLDLPGEDSFQRFAVTGQLVVEGQRVALEQASIQLDRIEGQGRLSVDASGQVPAINALLDVETLDLTPYMGDASDGDGSNGAGSAGWSDAPIDTEALRALNAELSFNAGGITLRDFTIGRSSLNVTLEGGRLTAVLQEANLYDGRGSGQILLDASGEVAGLVLRDISLTGFQAEPFLRDAAGYERLAGTANFQLPYAAGGGRSMRAIMSSLSTRRGEGHASGSFEFRDGALKGYNLAAMVRYAGTLFTDPSAFESRDTDFTRLGGTFTITSGVLNNPDLEMISPLLRLAGAGTANLGGQELDYRFEPRAVLTLEGQGGQEDIGGMVVPVNCTGPWADVNCRPDIAGVRVVGPGGQLRLPTPDVMQRVPDNMRERLPEDLRERLFRGGGAGQGEQQEGDGAAPSDDSAGRVRDTVRGLQDRQNESQEQQQQTREPETEEGEQGGEEERPGQRLRRFMNQ